VNPEISIGVEEALGEVRLIYIWMTVEDLYFPYGLSEL